MLFGEHIVGFLINLPLIYFHIRRVVKKKHKYDFTQIRRTDELQRELKNSYIIMFYYVILCIYNITLFDLLLLL
jgi:hypothetical protein